MLRLFRASFRLAVPLYLANLALSLGPAALFTAGLGAVAGDRPWAADLLGGDWLNQLIEVGAAMSSPLGRAGDGRLATAALLAALGGLLLVAMLIAQGVAYAFLAGGILERLRATGAAGRVREVRSEAVPFWRGCRRWFWPFLGLGILGAFAFAVLLAAVGVITAPLRAVVDPTVVTLLGVLLLSSINGWLELARADMVRQQYLSAPRALVRAARLLLLPNVLPRAFGIWVLAAILGLGLLALNAAAIRPTERVTWVTVAQALVVGQALAFLGAWLKVGRLAAALTLDRPATTHIPLEIEEPATDADELTITEPVVARP